MFFDAEHFFDGFRSNPGFALAVLAAAEEAGAERLVLCDTNGGMLPGDVADVVDAVAPGVSASLGIHVHNDTGCAVANSLVAVEHGVFQVQGVVNGYGERTGNADLIPIAANLVAEDGRDVPARRRGRATDRGQPLRRRGRERRAGLPAAVRRAGTPSPTRPACTRAASPGSPARTSTSSPRPSATTAASWRATSAAPRRCA